MSDAPGTKQSTGENTRAPSPALSSVSCKNVQPFRKGGRSEYQSLSIALGLSSAFQTKDQSTNTCSSDAHSSCERHAAFMAAATASHVARLAMVLGMLIAPAPSVIRSTTDCAPLGACRPSCSGGGPLLPPPPPPLTVKPKSR